MSSKKTKQKTGRHSTPVSSTPRRDTTLPHRSVPHHGASSNSSNSHHHHTSTYRALTPQVFHEHDTSQISLHQDPTYLDTIHTQHTQQLDANFRSMGVIVPDALYAQAAQNSLGMTPLERCEAHSTYPYQQHNSYQPFHEGQYADAAHHPQAHAGHVPSSIHADASSPYSAQEGYSSVYYAPQQEYYYIHTTNGEATSPGNDLAAVGTQFDSQTSSSYTQTT